MPDSIPLPVQHLLSDHIRSIAQLELLVLLQSDRARKWSVEDAARSLYTAASMTEPLMEGLVAAGLVAGSEAAPRLYQYWPRTPELDQSVRDLAKLYEQRRVTIINLIYSGPIQKLQNFADAFRIRKKEDTND
jgi:hypothetical protein